MTSARREAEKAFKTKERGMESEMSIDDMAKQIEELDSQLKEMKKAYRDRKMAGLKSAMEARKSAEEAVREELKALGVTSYASTWTSDPFKLYTKWY